MIETREKTITYDLGAKDAIPRAGQWLVSIGSKTNAVGTVYTILGVTLVRARTPRAFLRYRLTVRTCPGAEHQAVYHKKRRKVWVAGTLALPLFWYPRTKKRA